MTKRYALPAVIVTGGSILVGCGHHSGTYYSYGGSSCGSVGSCYPVRAYGRYAGVLGNAAGEQSTPVIAIFDQSGNGRMSGADGAYYRLTTDTAGKILRGNLSGFANSAQLPNGSSMTSDVITGTVNRWNLDAAVTDRLGNVQQLSLSRIDASSVAPSLTQLAGIWTTELDGTRLTLRIGSDGSLSGTDSNRCTYSGTFGVIGTRFDLYRESFDRICSGASTTFSGLSSHLPPASTAATPQPAQITMLADDDEGQFLSITLAKR